MKEENQWDAAQLWTETLAFVEKKGLPSSLKDNLEFKEQFQRFDNCFNLEFNPSASVVGAIVSQEVIKVITQKDFPCIGMGVYDAMSQKCVVEEI